ncbi:MAG: argininosuccinate lyase [Nitrospirae bacterium RBG_16_64_22]|nr:MAG: argininosuccinate lyase [Nitrospirae bacterium RBG_16_64_22]
MPSASRTRRKSSAKAPVGRKPRKPWGGRFAERTDPLVEAYTQSVSFDHRLAPYDIAGSIAHAKMLAKCRIISKADGAEIVRGLEKIRREIEEGRFTWRTDLEDVHMNVEARLTEMIGDAGRRLHTARSRNDQVALDLRLYLRDIVHEHDRQIAGLQRALLAQASRGQETVMPGYTHLQRAQPVLLAHHLLAHVEMLERDRERLRDAFNRINVMPLGSGALAGTPHPIDRAFTAKLLGFPRITRNSIDAVSDRDPALEYLAGAAILAVHLSRLAEEIVLWNTAEFGFVRIPDSFATGSSLMPQKKNPDVAEIARGKAGRAAGNFIALLTVMKGLPLSYNRDMQEDKEPLFDTADTVGRTLAVMTALVSRVSFDEQRMRNAVREGFTTATDLADDLVEKGVPFRTAHEVVGRIVRECQEKGRTLDQLTLADLRRHEPAFDRKSLRRVDPLDSIRRRKSPGGTSPGSVSAQIEFWERRLAGPA